MSKRMQIKFKEIAQDLAITHGLREETVSTILEAYSASVRRALAEDMIVEVIRGVRLEQEEYFDPRNSRKAIRLRINPGYALGRKVAPKLTEISDSECSS